MERKRSGKGKMGVSNNSGDYIRNVSDEMQFPLCRGKKFGKSTTEGLEGIKN